MQLAMPSTIPAEVLAISDQLRALEGTVTLLRARRYFLSRVDRVEFLPDGLRITGEKLRLIREGWPEEENYQTGPFRLGCVWEFFWVGHGMLYARWMAWSICYERSAVPALIRPFEPEPRPDTIQHFGAFL